MGARTTVFSFLGILMLVSAAWAQSADPADVNKMLREQRADAIRASLAQAKAYADEGRRDAAIEEYKKVLAIEQGNEQALDGLEALGAASAALPTIKLAPGKPSDSLNKPPPPAGGGGGDSPLGRMY
jgi:tetratricopeptide (TPR) repeat protein